MNIVEYLSRAKDWSYDKYEAQKNSAKRWRMAFFFQSGLALMLSILLISLFPLKRTIPMPVYINEESGFVRVDKPTALFAPEHEHMIKSDIVRYIRNREGYLFNELNHRIKQVRFSSSNGVFKDYLSRFSSDSDSLQNTLGYDGSIIVKVHNVVFLDSENNTPVMNGAEANLAKIDFTTKKRISGAETTEYWTATLSFSYRGLSQDEEMVWENWNGFTVLSYRLDKRVV